MSAQTCLHATTRRPEFAKWSRLARRGGMGGNGGSAGGLLSRAVLDRNWTKIVKFFLQVSRAEQKRRFLARLNTPEKEWKFSASDLPERTRRYEYMQAYEAAITATSPRWDHEPLMRAMVARILVDRPEVSDRDRAVMAEARLRLKAEGAS